MNLVSDINETLRDKEFKDAKPQKTIEHIKQILYDHGIETEETWFESGVPYCYSLRVTVCGTTFGANGKGLTREFALASAYGELMERLQLGYDFQKSGLGVYVGGKLQRIHMDTLLQQNRHWYESIAKCLASSVRVDISPKDILRQFADAEGLVDTAPYYCANTGTNVSFPIALRQLVYGTNGSAAGNTAEEAIVQAVSEIVERRHQTRILTEDISTPEIPDQALKQYAVAYDIISYLRSKGFRILVKDCSLGTKFPVVCVCFIDTATGKYHEHFGAYPIFEIALERALTESFQGRNISAFTKFEDFVYNQAPGFPISELMLSFVKGTSKEKPSFFIGKPENEWSGNCGFSGKSNKELLKECLEFFAEQGYDVLLRDCSCLDFPTYQVLIPGYSEILVHRLSPKHNEWLARHDVSKVLRNPSSARLKELLSLLSYIDRNKQFDASLLLCQFSSMAQIASHMNQKEERKFLAATLGYVFYTLEKIDATIEYIQQILPLCEQTEQEYLLCLKRYLSMKQHKYDETQIKALLGMFHKPETVQALYTCIAENHNPLENFTLHCNDSCDENCPLLHCCCMKQTNQLASKLKQKSDALDFDKSVDKLKKIL